MSNVLSWGFGGFGSLCLRETSLKNQLTPTVSETLTQIHVEKIAVGLWHSLIISENHSLYSVGRGRYGALGLGDIHTQDEFNSLQPRPVPKFSKIRVVDCAAGKTHSLAVADDGRIFSWGFGTACGHGNAALDSNPQEINSLVNYNIVQCSAGAHISACLDDQGNVFAWGNNITRPHLIKNGLLANDKAVKVSCGEKHTFILTQTGRLLGFGSNSKAQIHAKASDFVDGLTELYEVKCPVDGEIWKSVHSGLAQTVAVTSKDKVYIWGWMRPGTFVKSETLNNLTEVELPNMQGASIKEVFAGYSSVGILSTSGSVYMFGYGAHGNLGLGNTEHRKAFQRIEAFDSIFVDKIYYGCYNGYAVTGSSCFSDYEIMFRRGVHSDLTVRGEYIEYPAHKCILSARSPVLNSMIRSMPESETVLTLPFVPDELLPHVLEVIYSNFSTGLPSIDHVDLQIQEIFADKLQMGQVSVLRGNISASNDKYLEVLSTICVSSEQHFADVKFRLDDGTIFHAHKSILSSRSDYFKAMFSTGMIESSQEEIEFPETSANAFQELLLFLYTGKEDVSVESSVELCLLATRINCDRWKAKIELTIISHLGVDNCVEMISVADVCSSPGIQTACIRIIAEHYEQNTELKERVDEAITSGDLKQLIIEAASQYRTRDAMLHKIEVEDLHWLKDDEFMENLIQQDHGRQALASVEATDVSRVSSILSKRNKSHSDRCLVM